MGPAAEADALDAMIHLDEEAHWAASPVIPHPFRAKPKLEPAWEEVLDIRRRWRHDLARIRREVVQEVRLMIDDMAAETAERMSHRMDKPAVTQIPVMLELLRRID